MGRSDEPTTSIGTFVDAFDPWDGPLSGVTGGDPLGWPGYAGVLGAARERSGAVESVLTGAATVHGARAAGGGAVRADRVAVIAGVFDFVGGSLGLAAGERIVRAYDRARREELPVLVLARSGGARMQEGMVALVQMARTAAAARRHAEAGLVQVAWLDSPTTGGVYASFASLADVLWAPPGAVVGFAGPRVVEQTTGEALPDGAHTAESAAAAGIIDAVLEPAAARAALATLLRVAAGGREGPRGRTGPGTGPGAGTGGTGAGVGSGPGAPDGSRAPDPGPGTAPDAWAEVQRARDPHRPSGRAWLEALVPERVALSGDRAGGVDPVVACGLGTTRGGTAVAYVALDRHTLDGRPRPAGYRTARRAVALAARLGLPVLTLVDTPGADPRDASERAGVAGEIARTFAALGAHPAPTVSLVVGEGGSGGALAFAATDRCFLLDGAVFSVIGPEGAAAILDRDARRAPEVAPRLRLTGPDLVELGVVDAVLPAVLPAGASGSPSRDAGTGPSAVVDAIEGALANARPGDGLARLDSATRRWLNEAP